MQLRRLNGTPQAVLQDAELMQFFLPVLRADFAVCETYTYTPIPTPYVSDLSVWRLAGPQDELRRAGRLAQGSHPLAAGLRPEKSVKALKESIDRGYVHIKFTATKGGTELGVRLDTAACDFSRADFETQQGTYTWRAASRSITSKYAVSPISTSRLWRGKGIQCMPHLTQDNAVTTGMFGADDAF